MTNGHVHLDPARRHDFVYLFDVRDGNPNGDPDAGNLPRVDPETMQGLVTDVCIKRKIRDYVDAAHGEEGRYKIYVERRGILERQHMRAYEALGKEPVGTIKKEEERELVDEARDWMCANFFDVRTFGAVMVSKKAGCGQVRGPVQLTFARSVDPIIPADLTITRVAVTTEKEAFQSDEGDEREGGKETMFGRKALVPYGLYLGFGFVNPLLAEKTGFDGNDLALLWEALQMGFELDRSASRGLMALRGLYVFTHENRLGNAPAHTLLDRVRPGKKDSVDVSRSFADYTVEVNEADLPDGVRLTTLVG